MTKGNMTRKKIYEFIKSYIIENDYAPTYREISEGVGLKSINTVHRHMHKLQEQGIIAFIESKGRTIRILREFVED